MKSWMRSVLGLPAPDSDGDNVNAAGVPKGVNESVRDDVPYHHFEHSAVEICHLQDTDPQVDCRQCIQHPDDVVDCAKLLDCESVLDNLDNPDLNMHSCNTVGNAENGFIAVGSRFVSPEVLLQKCREVAASTGFIVATNGHQFPLSKPHPVHGPGKIWQRGKIYCTDKAHNSKTGPSTGKVIRTTCTWFVKFTFDRANV
jgi:hypothetical protein